MNSGILPGIDLLHSCFVTLLHHPATAKVSLAGGGHQHWLVGGHALCIPHVHEKSLAILSCTHHAATITVGAE